MSQNQDDHERLSAHSSEIRLDRPTEESWGRRDTTHRLVAAYQLGRLVNCREWLRVRCTYRRRAADSRRELTKVNGDLVKLAKVLNGLKHSARAARAIRRSESDFQYHLGSEQFHNWLEEIADRYKSWHQGTEKFTADAVYRPDKAVERALKVNRRLIGLINLGRLVDEGIRPVREMALSDFGLMLEERPVVEAADADADPVWVAAVRCRCSRFVEADQCLFQTFETLQESPEHLSQSDAVRILDEQIVGHLRSLKPKADKHAGPSPTAPGYLGLIVDSVRRVVRRDGFATEVNLFRSEISWHLFYSAYQAAGADAAERSKSNYPGDHSAIRTARHALNSRLRPLHVLVRRYRLFDADDVDQRKP